MYSVNIVMSVIVQNTLRFHKEKLGLAAKLVLVCTVGTSQKAKWMASGPTALNAESRKHRC
jgi:hypothetical protein